jgi:pyridoxal phosphate enzyme (YggS family)
MKLKSSLETILNNIERAKQKSSLNEEIVVVAATKTRPFALIKEVYSLGIRHIGENRIQEAVSKFDSFKNMPKITRRFIGHLQSNKINKFIKLFDTIDSIDSYKLVRKIDLKIEDENRSMEGLVEINTSGDKTKKGFKPVLSDELLQCFNVKNIKVKGLMTLGPFSQDTSETRTSFVRLRKFLDVLNKELGDEKLTCLSMGMSGDYQIAIEEGSTMIRVGTSLFGTRQ